MSWESRRTEEAGASGLENGAVNTPSESYIIQSACGTGMMGWPRGRNVKSAFLTWTQRKHFYPLPLVLQIEHAVSEA